MAKPISKKLELRIIAPNISNDSAPPTTADMVILYALTGELGILPGRAACSIVLGKGPLRVYNNGDITHMSVNGGIASINNDVVTVLSSGGIDKA